MWYDMNSQITFFAVLFIIIKEMYMKKYACFLIAVISFFLLSVETSTARINLFETRISAVSIQGNNSITGFVFTASRQPVDNIYIELLSDLNTTIARTRTNGSGFYSFRGLSQGSYNVKVLPYGKNYEEQSRSVALVGISAIAGSGAISEQADFYLKAKKSSEGPLAAPGVIFAQEVPDNVRKVYEEGLEFLNNGKEQEGFNKLKTSIEMFPEYYAALDRLGTEYAIKGYYRPAYVLLTQAIKINPKSFSGNFGLGLAQYHLQQFGSSVQSFQNAVNIYDKSINAYLWLGISLQQLNKFTEAEIALIKADKLSKGDSAEVHWQLAKLYNNQKRYKESADELEAFLKLSPKAEDAEKLKQTIQSLREKTNK